MKNLLYSLFICFVFSFSSCSEYGEEIWLNADGSGKYQMTQDMSQMLPFIEMGIESAKQKMEDKSENDVDETSDNDFNPEKLMNIFASGKVDTTITMESIMKKSFEKDGKIFTKESMKEEFFKKMNEEEEFRGTPAEKEKIWSFFEGIMNMTNRIQYDQEYASLKNTMSQSFSSTKDMLFGNLPELIDIISKYSGEDNEKLNDPKAKEAMAKMKDAFPTYEITKNMVKIRRKAMDLESDDPEAAQGLAMMKGMMGNSTYTMKIHVPGKVKKVSQAGAKFKGSTVTWTMPALDLNDTSKDLNLDIKFKPRKGIKY